MPRYFTQPIEDESSAADNKTHVQHEHRKVTKKKQVFKKLRGAATPGCIHGQQIKHIHMKQGKQKPDGGQIKHVHFKEGQQKPVGFQKQHKNDWPTENDPYPGRAEVPPKKLQRYNRGEGMKLDAGKTKFKKIEMKKREEKIEFSLEQSARAEVLLTEDFGYLEADEGERTCDITQKQIADAADITSASKHFNLVLKDFGPYRMDYSRNGRFLLIGGQKGHVAAMDWVTKKLLCEINVMESVHAVKWLHIETMFAVAQKKWTYIYDNQGVEIHCIKKLNNILQMEFLPYHFLLATSNNNGWLNWLDISIGKMVANVFTKMGRLDVMCQNPYNAVLCLGHPKGIVTMWTPNMQEPAVKMFCHYCPVRAIAVDPSGRYMATSSMDRNLKIWDARNLKCLQSCKMPIGASKLAFSQRGLLAMAAGDAVEIYKDWSSTNVEHPYLCHKEWSTITGLQFCPYEDVLGLSHGKGFASVLVPGAGEPNFDALESNPFQTKSQRRENEVKALLEKIQPELISLNPAEIGDVDVPTLKEKHEAQQKLLYVKTPKIDFTPRNKAKMKGGSAKQAKIKKGVIEERKRKFLKNALKKRKKLLEKEKTSEPEQKQEPEKPKDVLNRFRRFKQKRT